MDAVGADSRPSLVREPGRGQAMMPPPVAVPTLNDLDAHPELAQHLQREVAFQLYVRAHAVAAVCGLAAMQGESHRHHDDDHDQLIDAKETARILGRSVSWVQQRARSAPIKSCLVQSLGRGLLFSRRKIDRLIAREVGQNPDTPMLGLSGVNSGRRPRRRGNADPTSSPIPDGESKGG